MRNKLNQIRVNISMVINLRFYRHLKDFEILNEIFPNDFQWGLSRKLWPTESKCFHSGRAELFAALQTVFVLLSSCIQSLDFYLRIVCSPVYRIFLCPRRTLLQRRRDIHWGSALWPEGLPHWGPARLSKLQWEIDQDQGQMDDNIRSIP